MSKTMRPNAAKAKQDFNNNLQENQSLTKMNALCSLSDKKPVLET